MDLGEAYAQMLEAHANFQRAMSRQSGSAGTQNTTSLQSGTTPSTNGGLQSGTTPPNNSGLQSGVSLSNHFGQQSGALVPRPSLLTQPGSGFNGTISRKRKGFGAQDQSSAAPAPAPEDDGDVTVSSPEVPPVSAPPADTDTSGLQRQRRGFGGNQSLSGANPNTIPLGPAPGPLNLSAQAPFMSFAAASMSGQNQGSSSAPFVFQGTPANQSAVPNREKPPKHPYPGVTLPHKKITASFDDKPDFIQPTVLSDLGLDTHKEMEYKYRCFATCARCRAMKMQCNHVNPCEGCLWAHAQCEWIQCDDTQCNRNQCHNLHFREESQSPALIQSTKTFLADADANQQPVTIFTDNAGRRDVLDGEGLPHSQSADNHGMKNGFTEERGGGSMALEYRVKWQPKVAKVEYKRRAKRGEPGAQEALTRLQTILDRREGNHPPDEEAVPDLDWFFPHPQSVSNNPAPPPNDTTAPQSAVAKNALIQSQGLGNWADEMDGEDDGGGVALELANVNLQQDAQPQNQGEGMDEAES